MTPERWQQIRGIYERAATLGLNDRLQFLDGACASDSELRREVESLLAYEHRAGSAFLKTPAADLLCTTAVAAPTPPRIGRRIGVYQILEEIGHGGMGEVYRAARVDGQYEKQVAIKLVRSGYDSSLILERFRHERQILAGLDHPNIARLLDGGTTDEGIPYLVMELIEGLPIDEYCDQHDLGISERLELFTHVCSAVQYAHQRLVVHRDLKPSNILVNARGVPKLLDFGIAKILDPSAGAETTFARPMTPEFASPEQIRGEPITTATDVYSLGVVIYRLLTTRSPYPANTRTPHHLAQLICEVEPTRPSVASMKANTVTTARGRRLPETPAKLNKRLRGDLDNIILKALRKEPQRRYSSVEQLSEDIRRHLEGLPVTAIKGSFRYRASKFVYRHKAGVIATCAVCLVLAAGVGATIREARIARAERARAEKRFNDVRKLANSLMFEIHDSIQGLPGATTARALIVQRSREYLDSLALESGGDRSLQRELASAYEKLGTVQGDMYGSSLGDAKDGLQSLQKALAIRQSIARADPRNVEDLVSLARIHHELGRMQWYALGGTKEGLESLGQAVAIGESAVQIDPNNAVAVEALARAYQYLGDIQAGGGLRGGTAALHVGLENHLKALPLLQRVATANPSDPEKTYLLARAKIAIGDDYIRAGDAMEALKSYQEAEVTLRPIAANFNNAVYGRGYAVSHTRIGDALLMMGRADEALVHYRRERQVLEPLAIADPKDMVVQSTFTTSEGDIGHALVEAGQVALGKATLLRALGHTTAYAKATGDSYARAVLASTAALLGEAFERGKDPVTARRYYAQALELYEGVASGDPDDAEDAVNVMIMHNHLAGAYLETGETVAAGEEYRKATASEEALSAVSPGNVELLYAQADTYAGLGNTMARRARLSTGKEERSKLWSEAQEWYARSLNTWQRITYPDKLSPNLFRVTSPQEVARGLSKSKTAIVKVEAALRP